MSRTGADVVVEALAALDVDRVFVLASVHNLAVLEAVHRRGGMHVVNVRHEQSAVHAADGYARATGRLGVAVTSTGPGAANAMGALYEAGFASSPVLMITGQVENRFYGQGRSYLHEAEHQLEMLRSLTRQTWSVRRCEDLGEAVVAAGRAALAGRPQPTAVEIPVDLQYAPTDVAPPVATPVLATAPRPDRLRRATELLTTARRPLIWAGGGVIGAGAWPHLRRMVERLGIPVVTSVQGRGSLPEDHPLCLGPLATEPEVRRIVEDADVVLAVGTRFQMYPTDFWRVRLPPELIHVDVDASALGRSYPPRVALVGDAAVVLQELDRRITTVATESNWVTRATAAAVADREAAMESLGRDHRAFVEIIRRHLPPDGAIVRDSTVPAYAWGDRLLPVVRARTSLHPVSGAIGPGLPLALGATLGRGERSVVIHGDGGIMLTIGELATLAQSRVPLTVCVFNDNGYGVLRQIQAATFPGPGQDVDLLTPDFVTLARSMGVPGEAVNDVQGFETAFAASVASDGPYLIEIDLSALEPLRIPTGPQELLG